MINLINNTIGANPQSNLSTANRWVVESEEITCYVSNSGIKKVRQKQKQIEITSIILESGIESYLLSCWMIVNIIEFLRSAETLWWNARIRIKNDVIKEIKETLIIKFLLKILHHIQLDMACIFNIHLKLIIFWNNEIDLYYWNIEKDQAEKYHC